MTVTASFPLPPRDSFGNLAPVPNPFVAAVQTEIGAQYAVTAPSGSGIVKVVAPNGTVIGSGTSVSFTATTAVVVLVVESPASGYVTMSLIDPPPGEIPDPLILGSLVTKTQPVANVLAYGADPSGATDSTAAIQQALNRGGPVYLPAGEFYCSSAQLVIGPNTTLFGGGRSLTTLRAQIMLGTTIQGSSAPLTTEAWITDMTIDGSTGFPSNASGVNYRNVQDCGLRRATLMGWAQWAIYGAFESGVPSSPSLYLEDFVLDGTGRPSDDGADFSAFNNTTLLHCRNIKVQHNHGGNTFLLYSNIDEFDLDGFESYDCAGAIGDLQGYATSWTSRNIHFRPNASGDQKPGTVCRGAVCTVDGVTVDTANAGTTFQPELYVDGLVNDVSNIVLPVYNSQLKLSAVVGDWSTGSAGTPQGAITRASNCRAANILIGGVGAGMSSVAVDPDYTLQGLAGDDGQGNGTIQAPMWVPPSDVTFTVHGQTWRSKGVITFDQFNGTPASALFTFDGELDDVTIGDGGTYFNNGQGALVASQNWNIRCSNINGHPGNGGVATTGTLFAAGSAFNREVTTPAIAASGTAVQNQTGQGVVAYVAGGTVTGIAVNGISIGITSGPVLVPAGGTITLTYTAAPTWVWVGN